MSWFCIALIAPVCYALTNHIDKILLEKYFKESGVGTLMLFSSLLSALALPFFYLMDPSVFAVAGSHILILCGVGVINVLVLWLYFLALKDEEASVAIVFYQLVPVFAYILGYFILGETLTRIELLAMAIVILGTSIISFEIDSDNNFKLRRKTVILMTLASLFWAIGSVVFKFVELDANVWRSLFWEHCMLALIGLLLFLFLRRQRDHFLEAIRTNPLRITAINFLNELLYIIGNAAFAYAYVLAPIALVLLTDSFQPIFVLAIGIGLTIFFPRIAVEKIRAVHLWQKVFAIAITGIGTYLLLM